MLSGFYIHDFFPEFSLSADACKTGRMGELNFAGSRVQPETELQVALVATVTSPSANNCKLCRRLACLLCKPA
jgi:hypothetical protein